MNITSLVAEALEQMKRVDIYSEEFGIFSEMLVEDFEELGIHNNYELIDFYCNAVMLANYGGLGLVDVKGTSFQFGFAELESIIEHVADFGNMEGLSVNLKTQLKISNLRNLSLKSATSEEIEDMISEDVTIVMKAIGYHIENAKVDEELIDDLQDAFVSSDEELLEQLKKVSRLEASIEATIEDILRVYDDSLALGYELERPLAVMASVEEQLPYVAISTGANGIAPVRPTNFAISSLSRSVLKGLRGVKSHFDRQFSLETILNARDGELPIFPFKIAEFALGYRVTSAEPKLVYSIIGKNVWRNTKTKGNWRETYSQRGEIEKSLEKILWEYMVIFVKSNGLENEPSLKGEAVISSSLVSQINLVLDKFKRSACTFGVLQSKTGNEEVWASAEWMVVAPTECFTEDALKVDQELFQNVFKSDGDISEPIVKEVKGITIKKYRHIANPQVAEAEPLFAYKALQALQERGEILSPKNIIIGKGLNGLLLTSKNGARSALEMWKNLVHCTFAGSRSGKGVQVSSQVTPSIAAGRITFPHDRKPDTAVGFYELAGGQDEKGTPYGFFIQGGKYATGDFTPQRPETYDELNWSKNPKVFGRKDKLVPAWWGINSYEGKWGDFAYLRSMMLTLGILGLRAESRTANPALYEKLGGDDGVVIIYDEISNYINNFFKTYFSSKGAGAMLTKDVWSKVKYKELRKLLATVEGAKEGTKAKAEIDMALETYQDESYKLNVYLRDLVDNYNRTINYMKQQENAGFNQQESYRSDIYIIGQKFDIEEADTYTIPFTNEGQIASYNPNYAHLIQFLYNFQSDFVMGYHDSPDGQMWLGVPGSQSDQYLTSTARRFAYVKGASFRDIQKGDKSKLDWTKPIDQSGSVGSVYFKPYLLLGSDSGVYVEQLEKALGSNASAVRENNAQYDADGKKLKIGGVTQWNKAIGLPAYVKSIAGAVSDLGTSFKRAREVAEMVIHQMGYDGDYLDFLLDLRPEWNFSAEDVVDAFMRPQVYAKKQRMESWLQFTDLMSGGNGRVTVDTSEATGSVNVGIDGLTFADEEDIIVETENTDTGFNSMTNIGHVLDEDVLSTSFEEDTGMLEPEELQTLSRLSKSSEDEEPQQERIYQNLGNWKPIEETKDKVTEPVSGAIPVSEEGINRLAEALGIAPALIRSTYLGETVGSATQPSRVSEIDTLNDRPVLSRSARHHSFETVDDYMDSRPTLDSLREFERAVTLGLLEDMEHLMDGRPVEVTILGGTIGVNGSVFRPEMSLFNVPNRFRDLLGQVEQGRYASVVDYNLFFNQVPIWKLEVDSVQFLTSKIARPLGISYGMSVFKLFDIFPKLEELVIAGKTYSRNAGNQVLASEESFFASSRRRQQVLNRADTLGRDFRRNRWDSAKRYWATESGWKRFTGVTANLVGVGAGTATQLGAKTAVRANSLLKSAGNLFGAVAKELMKGN